jgi:tRNA threonylcarbamoyladenosine biosynthesis protein TsaE
LIISKLPGAFLTEFVSASEAETKALGERLAGQLKPGSVIALRGGLGGGKTILAKGIARGLGVAEPVTSPTYTIVSEYQGTLPGEKSAAVPIYHIDAYRLNGDEDFENIGGPELICGSGISIIEWSERIPGSLPAEALTVEIEITGGGTRRIRIR